MTDQQQDHTSQIPIQRWLVLTEFGVELQPIGNRGLVEQFAKELRPYRRRLSVVTETRYREVYGDYAE